MSASAEHFEIRSEARGPHWVAWVTDGGDGKPVGSAVLVGRTREEAEDRARRWAESLAPTHTAQRPA